MSMPTEQDDLPKRVASMDEAGITMAVLSVGALNIGGPAPAMPRLRVLSMTGSLQFVENINSFSLCRRTAVHEA